MFAYVIGQTALGDAYKLGNETPNIVYDLLLGGVLSATLVPLFTSFLRDGDGDRPTADGERATNVVITTAATLMIALTVVAVVAAPLVFGLYSITVSSEVDADLFRSVGTTLTRIFLVQILFYGLVGVANAYLQSRRRFFAAAWSPILPNLVIIATLLSLPGAGSTDWELSDVLDDSRLRWTLGLGATAGIASMALVVVPAMFMAGLRFRPAWDWKHPAVRKLLVLSSWTVGFVAANQVAVVVVRNLATREGEGIASAYFDAFTWFVLPHGLLAVSIATTFQPELARAVIQKQRGEFVDRLSLGTRLIVLLTLPGLGRVVRAARADRRAHATRAIRSRRLGQHGPRPRRSGDRAGRLLGLPVHDARLLRPPGHPHPVRAERRREPAQHRRSPCCWSAVGGCSDSGLAYSLAYLVAAAWALQVMSYKVPSFSIRAVASGLWRPLLAAVLMAEAMWFVARQSDDHARMGGARRARDRRPRGPRRVRGGAVRAARSRAVRHSRIGCSVDRRAP